MSLDTDRRPQRETILLVEDDPESLRATSSFLSTLGYETIEASGAAEAAEIARERAGVIDLLLAEAAMPMLSGIELARRLRATRPGLPVVLLAVELPAPGAKTTRLHVLRKPYSGRELAALLRSALEAGGR